MRLGVGEQDDLVSALVTADDQGRLALASAKTSAHASMANLLSDVRLRVKLSRRDPSGLDVEECLKPLGQVAGLTYVEVHDIYGDTNVQYTTQLTYLMMLMSKGTGTVTECALE